MVGELIACSLQESSRYLRSSLALHDGRKMYRAIFKLVETCQTSFDGLINSQIIRGALGLPVIPYKLSTLQALSIVCLLQTTINGSVFFPSPLFWEMSTHIYSLVYAINHKVQ